MRHGLAFLPKRLASKVSFRRRRNLAESAYVHSSQETSAHLSWTMLCSLSVALGVALLSWTAVGHARAAQVSPCFGSWLVHLNVAGRDVSEDNLLAFTTDGSVTLYGSPVLPALPGEGEIPLYASTGLGVWEPMENGDCAFEFVRVLAGDDGVGVGTLDVRATATLDRTAGSIEGRFDYTRATGFGQTAASGTGTITGTPIDGPLLWLTPKSGTTPTG